MAILRRKTSRRDALVKKAKAAVKKGGRALVKKAKAAAKRGGKALMKGAKAAARKGEKALMKGAKAAARKGGKALSMAAGRARVRLERAATDFRSDARRAGRKRRVKRAVNKARKALYSAGEVAMAIGTVAMNRMRARKKARRRRDTGPRMVRLK